MAKNRRHFPILILTARPAAGKSEVIRFLRSVEPEERLKVQGYSVPYSILENEDDVTSEGGMTLEERLEEALQRLWKTYLINLSS